MDKYTYIFYGQIFFIFLEKHRKFKKCLYKNSIKIVQSIRLNYIKEKSS